MLAWEGLDHVRVGQEGIRAEVLRGCVLSPLQPTSEQGSCDRPNWFTMNDLQGIGHAAAKSHLCKVGDFNSRGAPLAR